MRVSRQRHQHNAFTCLGAAFLAVAASGATGQTLQVRVVTTGGSAVVTVPNDAAVPVYIEARLAGTPTDGLAFFSTNLAASGTTAFDLCDQAEFLLSAPASLAPHFDRNGGLTNPPGLPISGYSGTCDGAGGLIQIGGAQNTIGNTGNPVIFPSGSVLTGVGNAGWTRLAEGVLVTPAAGSFQIVLTASEVLGSTIDPGQAGPVYHVTPIPPENIEVAGNLTISTGCMGPVLDADVNCDGTVDAGDLLAVRAPGVWQTASTGRADVNNDGFVNSGDLLAIRAPGTWRASGCPCNVQN